MLSKKHIVLKVCAWGISVVVVASECRVSGWVYAGVGGRPPCYQPVALELVCLAHGGI